MVVKKNKQKLLIERVLVAIVICALVLYVLYTIINLIRNPTDTFVIEKGKLSQEESTVGYIIRDEEVVTGQNYKNGIAQIKTEGERVAKGEAIFRYYTSGEEELVKKIQELDVKIQEAWDSTNNNILSLNDIKTIDTQIDTKLNQIYNQTNLQTISEYKKEILNNITKKAKIAGEASPAGSYLKSLIEERTKYETQLNEGSEYITAPIAGIVSYRVDGYEAVLSPNSFENLNKDMLERLNIKTGQIVSSSSESGKIIQNFQCYIACVLTSEEAMNTVVGDKVTIRLSNSQEVSAEVEYTAKQSDTENLIVFKINKNITELINYRKISLDIIWWSADGWKVPNSAIKVKNDQLSYVTRKRSGYTDDIYVKVLKQNAEYSIIENYTYSELSEIIKTMDVETEEERDAMLDKLSSRAILSLYDEILE